MQTPLKLVGEIIREKIFRHTNKEVPYKVWQENVGWTEMPDGSLRIDQYLIVVHESHKVRFGRHLLLVCGLGYVSMLTLTTIPLCRAYWWVKEDAYWVP
jgi:hypothetical protein